MKKSSKIVLCFSLIAVLICSMACTVFATHVGDIGSIEGGAFVKFAGLGVSFDTGYIDNLEFALPNTPAYVDTETAGFDEFYLSQETSGDAEIFYYVDYISQTHANNGTAVNYASVTTIDGYNLAASALVCFIEDFVGVQPRFGVGMEGDGANVSKVYRFNVTVDIPFYSFVPNENQYEIEGGVRRFTYDAVKQIDDNSLVYPYYDTFDVVSSFSGRHTMQTIQSVIEHDINTLHEQDGLWFAGEGNRYYHDMTFEVSDARSQFIPLNFVTVCYPYEENHDYEWRYAGIYERNVTIEEVEVRPFDWLVQAGQSALDFQLLPGLTVGHILLIMLAIPILIAALRLLAGG